MKITPVLLGVVFAQESGDYSDYEAPATGEDRWDSWGNDFLKGGGPAILRGLLIFSLPGLDGRPLDRHL